jgi:uncharacterized protein (DUF1697 family)
MPRLFAFLRAINVGGHTVKMDRLRQIFVELGFADVETIIASGNVAFRADEPAARELELRIAERLQAELGYAVATFVRDERELRAVAAHAPFAEDEVAAAHALSVGFVAAPLSPPHAVGLLALGGELDAFVIHGREVYWLRRVRDSDPTLTPARLERALGQPATFRNMTTVRRIAAKYVAER